LVRAGRYRRIRVDLDEPERTEEVHVRNVVATAIFSHPFNVEAIAKSFKNACFKGKFPGVVFTLKRPKATLLIFRTGKMVCTGAKSEREARRSILAAVKELSKGGVVIVERPTIHVENIVATVTLNCDVVDLVALAESRNSLPGTVLYEPEQFPALIYHMSNSRVTFLVFSSGKVVCVGAKTEKELHEAVERFKQTLREKGVYDK